LLVAIEHMNDVRRTVLTAPEHSTLYKPILIAIIEEIRLRIRELFPELALNAMGYIPAQMSLNNLRADNSCKLIVPSRSCVMLPSFSNTYNAQLAHRSRGIQVG
jgi:hypothetical protein